MEYSAIIKLMNVSPYVNELMTNSSLNNFLDSSPLYSLREVSLLRLVQSPSTANTAESTAHRLLQYIARVLGGGSQVEFRIPQVQLEVLLIIGLKDHVLEWLFKFIMCY